MFTTRPEIAGTFGVVGSTHWLASQVGMAVLERGGNAFDAAVAAGFTLHVAEPHLNGPGGDAPIIIHSARTGKQHVICGQGVAPAAASLEKFAQLGVDLIPATGLLPAVVPGAFDAWCLMLRDWGTWEFSEVLSYAIGYARNGVHLVPRVERHDRKRPPAVRGGMAVKRRGVPARRQGPRARQPVRPSGARRNLRAPLPSRDGAVARGAHRRGAGRLVPRLRRRGGGQVLPRHRCAGRDRHASSRPARPPTIFPAGRRRSRIPSPTTITVTPC